jgi:hypothetical protein
MTLIRGSSETHCHCGAAFRGSDHCPECYCEQYEQECKHRIGTWLVYIGRSKHPMGGVSATDDLHFRLGEYVAELLERGHSSVRVELETKEEL